MATHSRSRLIRRIAYVLVGLVIIGFIASRVLAPQPGPEYMTAKVENGDVGQTVALTGTTEPKIRYQLQFTRSARIDKILVEVGGAVKEGDVLAVLENNDANYQLESQKAVLRIAQANLAKAVAGQRPEEVELSQLKVDLARMDLENSSISKQTLTDLAQKNVNSAYLAVQSAKTSLEQAQDQYNYTLQNVQMDTWQQPAYSVYDSGYYYGDMRGSLPQGEGSAAAGGSVTGTGAGAASGASYGAGSGSYVSNVNNIQTAQYNVQKAQNAFDQAQEAYDKATVEYKRQTDEVSNVIDKANVGLQSAKEQYKLTTAKPREVDVAPLKAQVDQAWVGVNLAQYQLDQTELKAPADGIVTSLGSDVGETASMAQPLITIDSKYLHIKALVSEADIAKIQVGQNAVITFDAFGTVKEFKGNVYEVDPSETIVQGVVYYVVKIQFDAPGESVKPGMTANLTVQTDTKPGVLNVPARAVQYDGNQPYVQVLKTVDKKQEVEKRNVEVGLQGDELIEIVSGLQAGEEVVTFTKSKE